MKNQVTIKDKQGNTESVELISYFKVKSTGKAYLFYTKNEIVQNGLAKMYAISIGDNTISDADWTYLKSVMQGMITNKNLDDLEFLKVEGVVQC